MTRKPDTPLENGPAGNSEATSFEAGLRFTGNENILKIEQELLKDGTELDNRAIPDTYHARHRDYADAEIAEIVESEANKEHPNRQLIGYLNGLKDE